MGAEIINAIKSGLGLIKDIAGEFLNGFTTLFWVEPGTGETVGHLTSFGTWCLIMLGVAITFSVVKLVLNLVRSNTGV